MSSTINIDAGQITSLASFDLQVSFSESEPDPDPTPEGLIQSTGFESGEPTSVSELDSALSDHPDVDGFRNQTRCGGSRDTANDPTGATNRTIRFTLGPRDGCGDGGGSADAGRCQDLVDSNHKLTEAFQRVRVYFHPDIRHLLTLEGWGWYLFSEIFVSAAFTNDDPPWFRMSLYVERLGSGSGDDQFTWMVRGQTMDSIDDLWTDYWVVDNRTVPVPIDEWFTAEIYYKMGDADNGRLIFSIQPDGGEKQTVADVTNWTYHPDKAAEGFARWDALKMYVRADMVDHVLAQGGSLRTYWDDWELWETAG